MILFSGGAPAATKVGAEPKSRIQAWLESVLPDVKASAAG
jgi:thioredoxin 1